MAGLKKLFKADEHYLKVVSLRNMMGNPAKTERNMALQLIHLLFNEAFPEMLSVEWELSKNHSLGRETGRKV